MEKSHVKAEQPRTMMRYTFNWYLKIINLLNLTMNKHFLYPESAEIAPAHTYIKQQDLDTETQKRKINTITIITQVLYFNLDSRSFIRYLNTIFQITLFKRW